MKIRRLCIAANNSSTVNKMANSGPTYLFPLQISSFQQSILVCSKSHRVACCCFSTDAVSMHSKLQAAHVSAVPSVFFHKFSSIEFYAG